MQAYPDTQPDDVIQPANLDHQQVALHDVQTCEHVVDLTPGKFIQLIEYGHVGMYMNRQPSAGALPVIHMFQRWQHYATCNISYQEYAQLICEMVAHPTRIITATR